MSRSAPLGPRALLLLPLLSSGLILATGLACRPSTQAAGEELSADSGVKKRETPPVRTTEVARREMSRVLETTSKLESEREIQIFPRSSGVAVEVHAEEGDAVVRGTLLAKLDDRDEALAVRDAEVALREAENARDLAALAVDDAKEREKGAAQNARQAERDFERDRRLAESTTVASPLSIQALEASELARDTSITEELQATIALERAKQEEKAAANAIDRAQVALERAQLALEYRSIFAPFDGVIAMRTIRVGDSVGTAEASFVLTDIDSLRAVFARPQEELELFGSVSTRAEADRLTLTATTEAQPDREFEGYIERISPTIEADSGQFRVTARVEPHNDASVILLPGMLIRMKIVIDRHSEALVVPKRALRREGDRRYILAVERFESSEDQAGRVRRVNVREGYSDEDYVEVLPVEGLRTLPAEPENGEDLGPPPALAPGLEIVLVGSRDLAEGSLVRVDDPDAGSSVPTVSDPASADDDEGAEGE